MKEKTLLHKILPYLLVLPSMLLLVVVVLFPIISNIGRSFQLEEGGMGLDNYIYFFWAIFFCKRIVRMPPITSLTTSNLAIIASS